MIKNIGLRSYIKTQETNLYPGTGNGDDYFAYNGSTFAWYGAATGEQALYDPVTNKTYITYEGWNGTKRTVAVMFFDHTTSAWSDEVVASTDTMTNDDHGVPVICMDGAGYFHIFFGAHNSDQKWIKSTNARDITAWTIMPTKTGDGLAYPHPVVIGTTLINIGRSDIGNNKKTGVLYKNTTSAWGSKVIFGDFGNDTRYYVSNTLQKSGKIHFAVTKSDYADTWRRNIYYMIYDPAADTISNNDGSHTVTAASFPINAADHDTYFKIYTHNAAGTYSGNIPAICFDDNGHPHIIFYNGLTTGVGYLGGGFADIDIMHMYWTGSAWSAPAIIGHCSQKYEDAGLTNIGNGKLQLLYMDDALGSPNYRGGNIYIKTRSAAGIWGNARKIRDQESPRGLDRCKPVLNAHANLRWLFLEGAPSQDYDGIAIDNDTKAGYQRLFAYGDKGYARNANPHITNTSLTISENAAIGTPITSLTGRNIRQSYTIMSDPDGKFAISGGNLVTNATFDCDTAQSHIVTIGATIRGVTHTRTYSVAVTEYIASSDQILATSGLTSYINADTVLYPSGMTVSSNQISAFADLSGNGKTPSQGTGSLRPLTGTRALNGINLAEFDGTDDTMAYSSNPLTAGPATVIAVFVPDTTAYKIVFGNNRISGNTRYYISNQRVTFGLGDRTRTTSTSGSGILQVGRVSAAGAGTSYLKINSDTEISGTSQLDGIDGSFALGSYGTGLQDFFDGDIGLVATWNRMLSNAEVNTICQQLATRYGISWTDL